MTKTNDNKTVILAMPADEEEMRERGVYTKYLDAQEAWIIALVRQVVDNNYAARENVKDTRRRLMNVIFTGEE